MPKQLFVQVMYSVNLLQCTVVQFDTALSVKGGTMGGIEVQAQLPLGVLWVIDVVAGNSFSLTQRNTTCI